MPKKGSVIAPKSLAGSQHGDVTVIGHPFRAFGSRGKKVYMSVCRCSCGKKFVAIYGNLCKGGVLSCGCSRGKAANRVMRNADRQDVIDIRRVWHGMKLRCDPYKCPPSARPNYAGRGITVCEQWSDFWTFFDWAVASGWNRGLSIDRVNVDGHYEPSNCRWATATQQARNTRRNRWLSAFGEEKVMAEWTTDPRCVVGYGVLSGRIQRNWTPEDAISTPVKRHSRKEASR